MFDFPAPQSLAVMQRNVNGITLEQIVQLANRTEKLERMHALNMLRIALKQADRCPQKDWIDFSALRTCIRKSGSASDPEVARRIVGMHIEDDEQTLRQWRGWLQAKAWQAESGIENAVLALCGRDLLPDLNAKHPFHYYDPATEVHTWPTDRLLDGDRWCWPMYVRLTFPWRFAMRSRVHSRDKIGLDREH